MKEPKVFKKMDKWFPFMKPLFIKSFKVDYSQHGSITFSFKIENNVKKQELTFRNTLANELMSFKKVKFSGLFYSKKSNTFTVNFNYYGKK